MTDSQKLFDPYAEEVLRLASATSTTEESYYPAIKGLLTRILDFIQLPFDVRTSTSESRAQGGRDLPDFALYDGPGEFLVVCGEAKLPGVELAEIAFSEDRNNQVGRYLAQTGAVLVCNVRGFGLVTAKQGTSRQKAVAATDRILEYTVELWPSTAALVGGHKYSPATVGELEDLIEAAVTRYAAIAEPESLAKVLARQARRAKQDLPTQFSQAVAGLAEDFGKALGVTFEGPEGEEFFRSSLIQTVFYGLFAGWTLWVRSGRKKTFVWEDLGEYLKIPFLGGLFYEFRHPRRIQELGLKKHLDLATETLSRIDVDAFFSRFQPPSLEPDTPSENASAAILYFYEPFLESFDPVLRKELGVWYTPAEVVRYQVQRVDRLLREELGCERGFADDRVVALDPCCGTGAYLIEILRCVAAQLRSEGIGNMLGTTLLDLVERRILGFEILTAPFVITQLQIYLILAELGTQPPQGHRPAVFLTNALTGWDGSDQLKLHFPELQEEHDAAQAVKRSSRIIVVIGNPPYNRFAGVPVAEEAELVDHYKGIERDKRGRQIGPTALFAKWGIRKQLLDDLYIRFFRLAERCIGERAQYGVVSFISNYSFYGHRSHPLMRESLLRSFSTIWLDVLNGDKYKTGKVVPKGVPGEGTSDQSIFTTANDPRGIQVGTGITTLLKREQSSGNTAVSEVFYRDFWGKSDNKRKALLASLSMQQWSTQEKSDAAKRPAGPREYEHFTPTQEKRWKLLPYESQGGFEDWIALDELFESGVQGINPNRGIFSSVIDVDKNALIERMQDYFSDAKDAELQEKYVEIFTPRAGYDPHRVRKDLLENSSFDENKIVPYVLFPLDARWLYYEVERKLLNRGRPELWKNLKRNEFLVAVPEPRQYSEMRPLLLSCAFDLHLHDRGSIGFPAEIQLPASPEAPLFGRTGSESTCIANINERAWSTLKTDWTLAGTRAGQDAKKLARQLAAVCVAVCHSPAYETEHKESLAQDWAHIPIPRDRTKFLQLAQAGATVAVLLDPLKSASGAIREILPKSSVQFGIVERTDGKSVTTADLAVEYSFFGAAVGGWRHRPTEPAELPNAALGKSTGDLFINDRVRLRNVPQSVWEYQLGGYPVIKKWLGYRDRGRRGDKPLSVQEMNHLRNMVQRIAALLVFHSTLDQLYEAASDHSFTVDELTESNKTAEVQDYSQRQ